MTKQRSQLQHVITVETWNEELSRAKKYKEATQKRKEEKRVSKEIEKVRKENVVGRLQIEP
jgi:hypothetical protein